MKRFQINTLCVDRALEEHTSESVVAHVGLMIQTVMKHEAKAELWPSSFWF